MDPLAACYFGICRRLLWAGAVFPGEFCGSLRFFFFGGGAIEEPRRSKVLCLAQHVPITTHSQEETVFCSLVLSLVFVS